MRTEIDKQKTNRIMMYFSFQKREKKGKTQK
jgi:hypothetical protein